MFILAECDIPPVITGILSQLYKIIIILVPIGIVIFGSIDFIKATIAKNNDAIAATTKTFVSRLIAGAVTFFVLAIVTWLFKVIIKNVGEANSAMQCALEIIGGSAGSYNSSGTIDWINDTLDKTSVGQNCLSDCNNYCGTKTNSTRFIQACSNYCAGYQREFKTSDAPCN